MYLSILVYTSMYTNHEIQALPDKLWALVVLAISLGAHHPARRCQAASCSFMGKSMGGSWSRGEMNVGNFDYMCLTSWNKQKDITRYWRIIIYSFYLYTLKWYISATIWTSSAHKIGDLLKPMRICKWILFVDCSSPSFEWDNTIRGYLVGGLNPSEKY